MLPLLQREADPLVEYTEPTNRKESEDGRGSCRDKIEAKSSCKALELGCNHGLTVE